ncbi:MAG: sigma-70 family RNA polymerase sigma factor [Gemmataceae bacterium]|nr:sigma-70 family RNA polymerase sigma factor [Gemmataceae bacterium]
MKRALRLLLGSRPAGFAVRTLPGWNGLEPDPDDTMNSVLPPTPADKESPALAVPSDGQLLSAFVEAKDQAAFETIVHRHGPMVFGVARRLLGNEHDAADVFQAVFLVLARKAAAIRSPDVLGAWLYNVAYRTSIKARAAGQKRKTREGTVSVMPEPAVECEPVDDVLELLDEELRALPAKYQTPLVLCDLQGQSRRAAAEMLQVPEGTISSRLATGRKKLADRLRRRGVTVSAVALGAILAQNAASAAVPAPLVAVTVQAALPTAAGQTVAGLVSAKAMTLSQGVIQSMLLAKLQLLLLVVMTPLLVGGALLGFVAQEAAPDDEASAIAKLKKLGAKIRWEATPAGKQVVYVGLKGTRAADEHIKLLRFFKELRELWLSETRLTDAGCADLAPLQNLQTLRLGATSVSDAGLKHLTNLRQLKDLAIGWTKITDAGLKDLSQLTELRELDLRQTALTDEGLKSLRPFRKLETLQIALTKITDAGLKELHGFDKLRVLNVQHNRLGDAAIKNLALISTLESVSLENNPVTDAGIKDLVRLTQLTALNLAATKISDDCLADLAQLKRLGWLVLDQTALTGAGFEKSTGFKQLGVLWLSGTQLTDENVKHVAALSSIAELRIQKTEVTDAGVKELAPLRQLASLSLDNTKVTDASVRELAGFQRLWLLNLSGTKVGDAGLKELAELARVTDRTRRLEGRLVEPAGGADPAIKLKGKIFKLGPRGGIVEPPGPVRPGFPALRWLGLHDTPVTDAGVKHLAALPNLNTLWLSWTNTTEAGLKDIARLQNLHTLRLGGVPVTDEGVKDLATMTNLRALWLDWTKVTDAGLKHLAPLTRLEELRLDGTQVSDAGLQELAALKQLRNVELQKTAVTDAGVAQLQAKLNNVTINTKAAGASTPQPSGRAFWWLLGALGVLLAGSLFALLFVKRKSLLTPALLCVSLAATAVIGYRVVLALTAAPPAPQTDAKVRLLKGHQGPVHDLRFTPDGKKLISVSGWPGGPAQDYTIRIWDLATDQELMRIPAPGQIGAIELTADGRFLLVGSHGAVFHIDADSGQILKRMTLRSPVAWVSLAADGKHAYTASLDGIARKWSLEDGKEVSQVRVAGKWARFVAEAPDGQVLTVDSHGMIQFWNFTTGQETRRINGNVGWMSAAALAPGGKEILLAGWNVAGWDLATGKKLRTFDGHQGDVPRLVFSPDAKKLLTCSYDGTVKLWDYETAALLHDVSAQDEFVFTVMFSPDGRTIAHAGGGRKQGDNFLAGEDHDIRILDVSGIMDVQAPSADAGTPWRTVGLVGAAIALAAVAGFVLWRGRHSLVALVRQTAVRADRTPGADSVTFPCPQCRKNLKAKNSLAGRKVKCPRCAAVTLVPSIQAPTRG